MLKNQRAFKTWLSRWAQWQCTQLYVSKISVFKNYKIMCINHHIAQGTMLSLKLSQTLSCASQGVRREEESTEEDCLRILSPWPCTPQVPSVAVRATWQSPRNSAATGLYSDSHKRLPTTGWKMLEGAACWFPAAWLA